MRHCAAAGLALAAMGACSLGWAQGVVPAGELVQGEVRFDARATLGGFVGRSTRLRGEMTGGADLRDVRGWVELEAASLETGNGLRDRDLRKALEVERYPVIRFDLDAVSLLFRGVDSAAVMLTGRFTIRGVSRQTGIPATVQFESDGTRVRAAFPLNLDDYGVRGLRRLLILRMSPDILVHVDLRFAPRAAAAPPGGAHTALRPGRAGPRRGTARTVRWPLPL
jgi:polyisoprenoid-binding protein YceI